MTIDNQITAKELYQSLNSDNPVLLDIRPIAAYNGWALDNEPRGGHIRGAKAFPLVY
jgi:thiosulfate/3-mercaptopyruvate sulfurtransferase